MALQRGFDELADAGSVEKAIIFTESRRTQEYLRTISKRRISPERPQGDWEGRFVDPNCNSKGQTRGLFLDVKLQ